MNTVCSVLENHVNRPFNNRTLPVEHGRGTVSDGSGENAIKVAFTLDVDDRIADVAFRSYGNPMLTGCGSFLTEVLRGQTLSFACRVRANDLAGVLQLRDDDRTWALMAVRALQRALRDHRLRRPDGPRLRGPRPGTRRALFVPPFDWRNEHRLLFPGESVSALLFERARLCNCLLNLDLCLQVAIASPTVDPRLNSALIERKAYQCSHLAILEMTIPTLAPDEREFLARLGLHEQSLGQGALALGLTENEAIARVWSIARWIQEVWRGRGPRVAIAS